MKSVLFFPKFRFFFFLNSVFPFVFFWIPFLSRLNFSGLLFNVKLNCINQKVCLINKNYETYTI